LDETLELSALYKSLGFCHRKLEKFDQAVLDYTAAIAVDRQNIRAYNNRAYCLAKLGRFSEAVDDYSTVIKLDPLNSHAYHNRGISLEKLNLFDEAISDFSHVLELDSQVSSQATTAASGSANSSNMPAPVSASSSAISVPRRQPPPGKSPTQQAAQARSALPPPPAAAATFVSSAHLKTVTATSVPPSVVSGTTPGSDSGSIGGMGMLEAAKRLADFSITPNSKSSVSRNVHIFPKQFNLCLLYLFLCIVYCNYCGLF